MWYHCYNWYMLNVLQPHKIIQGYQLKIYWSVRTCPTNQNLPLQKKIVYQELLNFCCITGVIWYFDPHGILIPGVNIPCGSKYHMTPLMKTFFRYSNVKKSNNYIPSLKAKPASWQYLCKKIWSIYEMMDQIHTIQEFFFSIKGHSTVSKAVCKWFSLGTPVSSNQ